MTKPERFTPPPRRTAEEIEAKFRTLNEGYGNELMLPAEARDPETFGILAGSMDTISLARVGVPPSSALFHDIRKDPSPTPYQRGVMQMTAWLGVGRPFRSEQAIAQLRDQYTAVLIDGVQDKKRALLFSIWEDALSWVLGGSERPLPPESDALRKAREGYDPDELPPLAENEPG